MIKRFLCCLCLSLLLSKGAKPQSVASVDSTLNQLEQIGNDSLRLEAVFTYMKGLWETAPNLTFRVINTAMAEAKKSNSKFFIGKSFSAYGYSYLLATDYPRSLNNFLEALAIWRQLGDHAREVETLIFISNIHSRNGDLQKAKQYAEQAIVICTHSGVGRLEAKALNELAIVYEKQHQPLDAISIYNKGIEAARREHDKYFEAFLLGNRSTSYKSLGQNERALNGFLEVIHISDSLKDPYMEMVGWYNIADLYFDRQDLAKSEEYALRSLDIAKEINESETITGAYHLLKEIAIKKGDYRKALDYLTKEVAIRDTIFNQKKSSQLAEMQTRFDTKLKDRQIHEQHTQITLSRKMNTVLLVGIALLALIGMFIWFQQRRTSKLHRQVAAQKQELEQLNNVKDRIFSVISHDMRTPVNSLLAFMQLMEHGSMSQEKLAAYGAELKTSMTDTAALLENLLNWAKSQMQGYRPVIERFDLEGPVDEAIRLLLPELQKKEVTVSSAGMHGIGVSADINMTAIVLRNLLHNALKYTHHGGSIDISAKQINGSVELEIRDTGIGFSEDMVRLFNRGSLFEPLNSTPGTEQEQGTGLGLLLCRTFLQQMNGSIRLESKQGEGSVFTIVFPAAS